MSTGDWLSKLKQDKCSETETIRTFRLSKIKQMHKPMDYEKLKQHQKLYYKVMDNRKQKKKKELDDSLSQHQSAFKLKFKDKKSKKYKNLEKTYFKDIGLVDREKEDYKKRQAASCDMAQNYTKKFFPPVKDYGHKNFPKEGRRHYEWINGRFGAEEWYNHMNLQKELTKHKKTFEKGNEYFKSEGILKLTEKQKEVIMEKRKEDELKYLLELREKNAKKEHPDYIKEMYNSRKKNPFAKKNLSFDLDNMKGNFYNMLNTSKNETILDDSINFFSQKRKNSLQKNLHQTTNAISNRQAEDMIKNRKIENIFTDKKKKLFRINIEKFDERIKTEENCTNVSPRVFVNNISNIQTNEDLLDKYYVKSIRAKLALQKTSHDAAKKIH